MHALLQPYSPAVALGEKPLGFTKHLALRIIGHNLLQKEKKQECGAAVIEM
jgi:hypothetical protein